MKKVLIVLLILVLLLSGLFFWKGGHHAIGLANVLDEWLDDDDASHTLTIRVPGIEEGEQQLPLTADVFWTEYGDRHLFGLTAQNVSVWTDGKNLYMDTGAAYALPNLSILDKPIHKLMMMNFLLFGRVSKTGDTYDLSLKYGDLKLSLEVTADRSLQELTLSVRNPDGTAFSGSLVPSRTDPPSVPREVSDAIVLARMEPPAPLMEPVAVLFPVLENLLPLRGELTMRVEGGIEDFADTMDFTMDSQTIELEHDGEILCVNLPAEISGADPKLLGLLLLRNAAFIDDGGEIRFEVALTAEETDALCDTLVPGIKALGMEFTESHATVTIEDGALSSVTLTADGEVSLLFNTAPVYFSAELITS